MTTPKDKTSEKLNDEVTINGIKYRHIHALYCFSRNITKTWGVLVDRGANGGLEGYGVRIISKSLFTVNTQCNRTVVRTTYSTL